MRLSYSAISTFQQCPLKYERQYIERIKVPPTPDQFFGILIHEVLEIALKNDPVVPSIEKLIEFYNTNWKPTVFQGGISEKEFYQDGLDIIKNFHSSHTPGLTTVLETERFFEIYWQGHKIVGKIDRVDRLPTGEVEIIDYKTNKKLPGEDDFNYDFQLPLYRWAASTIWNDVKDVKLTLHFLRHNKKLSPVNIKALPELQDYILKNVDFIQKSDFKPTPSKLCGWCEYLNRCEEGQQFLQMQNSKIKNQNDPFNYTQGHPERSRMDDKLNFKNNYSGTSKRCGNKTIKFAQDSLFGNLD